MASLARLSGSLAGAGRAGRAALALATLWSALVLSYAGGYFLGPGAAGRGPAFLDALFFLVAFFLPLGLIGLAVWLSAELVAQRRAVADLVAALDETRSALRREGGGAAPGGGAPGQIDGYPAGEAALRAVVAAPLGEIREAQRRLAAEVGRLAALVGGAAPSSTAPAQAEPERRAVPLRRAVHRKDDAGPALSAGEEEPELPDLAAEPEVPLGIDDLVRALDFPRDSNDSEGFDALKRALRQHVPQLTLQAAEDVMNLLAQEGIYTDDLEHRPGPAWTWRALAEGRRGDALGAAGGIRDEAALAAVRRMMRADTVFRDAALIFLRRFDALLREVAPGTDDAALLALADTRSGRAFQLCARASGAFG